MNENDAKLRNAAVLKAAQNSGEDDSLEQRAGSVPPVEESLPSNMPKNIRTLHSTNNSLSINVESSQSVSDTTEELPRKSSARPSSKRAALEKRTMSHLLNDNCEKDDALLPENKMLTPNKINETNELNIVLHYGESQTTLKTSLCRRKTSVREPKVSPSEKEVDSTKVVISLSEDGVVPPQLTTLRDKATVSLKPTGEPPEGKGLPPTGKGLSRKHTVLSHKKKAKPQKSVLISKIPSHERVTSPKASVCETKTLINIALSKKARTKPYVSRKVETISIDRASLGEDKVSLRRDRTLICEDQVLPCKGKPLAGQVDLLLHGDEVLPLKSETLSRKGKAALSNGIPQNSRNLLEQSKQSESPQKQKIACEKDSQEGESLPAEGRSESSPVTDSGVTRTEATSEKTKTRSQTESTTSSSSVETTPRHLTCGKSSRVDAPSFTASLVDRRETPKQENVNRQKVVLDSLPVSIESEPFSDEFETTTTLEEGGEPLSTQEGETLLYESNVASSQRGTLSRPEHKSLSKRAADRPGGQIKSRRRVQTSLRNEDGDSLTREQAESPSLNKDVQQLEASQPNNGNSTSESESTLLSTPPTFNSEVRPYRRDRAFGPNPFSIAISAEHTISFEESMSSTITESQSTSSAPLEESAQQTVGKFFACTRRRQLFLIGLAIIIIVIIGIVIIIVLATGGTSNEEHEAHSTESQTLRA